MSQEIKKQFKDCLKEYLLDVIKTEVEKYGLDLNVYMSNDIDFLLQYRSQFKENDVFCLLSTGNATKTTTSTKFYSQALQVTMFCNVNLRAKLNSIFEEYTKGTDDSVGQVGSYYANVTWNTPMVDSNLRTFNGMQIATIMIQAEVTYCDVDFSTTKIPTIQFKVGNSYQTLNNVYSLNVNKITNYSSYTMMGQSYQKKIEEFIQDTYDLEFLFLENDSLHETLLSQGLLDVKIGTESFQAFVDVSYTLNVGSFTSIALKIVR